MKPRGLDEASASRAPRVVIATRTFAPDPAAAALRLSALARALVDTGADVDVLTSRPLSGDYEAPKGVRVRRAPVLRDRTGAVRGYIPYMSFDVPLFFRLLACRRPDVVVNEPPPTTGIVTRAACAIRRIPQVYFAADIVSDAASAQGTAAAVTRTVAWMERTAMRGAARVIAVSEGVARRVAELSGRNALVVPNGIDVTRDEDASGRFAPRTGAPDGFPTTDAPVFLYAGTVASWLAPEAFIDAIRIARERIGGAVLVFLGQGGSWEDLRALAAGDEGIVFHDSVDPESAQHWYAAATASLASIRPGAYDYAYPTKILSSLSAGTPVVYAGPGRAARDVEDARLGCAVELDARRIADAMVELASAPADDPRLDAARLHAWVRRNRSVAVSSSRAAAVVLAAAKKRR